MFTFRHRIIKFIFQLVAKRYNMTSTIITTNKPLSKWG
ncbi:ATP-binding protein [Mycoplasmatota bacterium]|nr:ATP-binding protein [Mycoplasmatota bacterium]